MTECFEIWRGNSLIRRGSGIGSVLEHIAISKLKSRFSVLKDLEIEIKLSGKPGKVREFCFEILGDSLP